MRKTHCYHIFNIHSSLLNKLVLLVQKGEKNSGCFFFLFVWGLFSFVLSLFLIFCFAPVLHKKKVTSLRNMHLHKETRGYIFAKLNLKIFLYAVQIYIIKHLQP